MRHTNVHAKKLVNALLVHLHVDVIRLIVGYCQQFEGVCCAQFKIDRATKFVRSLGNNLILLHSTAHAISKVFDLHTGNFLDTQDPPETKLYVVPSHWPKSWTVFLNESHVALFPLQAPRRRSVHVATIDHEKRTFGHRKQLIVPIELSDVSNHFCALDKVTNRFFLADKQALIAWWDLDRSTPNCARIVQLRIQFDKAILSLTHGEGCEVQQMRHIKDGRLLIHLTHNHKPMLATVDIDALCVHAYDVGFFHEFLLHDELVLLRTESKLIALE